MEYTEKTKIMKKRGSLYCGNVPIPNVVTNFLPYLVRGQQILVCLQ